MTTSLKKLCSFAIVGGPSKLDLMLHTFDRAAHPAFKLKLQWYGEDLHRPTTDTQEFVVKAIGPADNIGEAWSIELFARWDAYTDKDSRPASVYHGQYNTYTREGNLDRLIPDDYP